MPRLRRPRLALRRLTSSLLFVPAMGVVVALALAAAALAVDAAVDEAPLGFLFTGNIDTARSLLSSLAAATVTLTGLTFSITMLVLQLTSSQYSPRVLRSFLADRNSQVTLAIFVGTFVYTMAVLRSIDGGRVPGISLSLAVFVGLVAVGTFIQFINHVAERVQAASIIQAVADATEAAIDRRFPEPTDGDRAFDDQPRLRPGELDVGPRHVVTAPRKGVVQVINEDLLVQKASEAGVQVVVRHPVGAFVPKGAPLLEVRGEGGERLDGLTQAVVQGRDRNLDDDPIFGLRQLVDIAERALSPGTNDPTTAVQAIDQLHHLLRRIAAGPIPKGLHTDAEGTVRVVIPEPRWEDYLGLAVAEIAHYGEASLQVRARIDSMLRDLADAASTRERRDAVLWHQKTLAEYWPSDRGQSALEEVHPGAEAGRS